MPFPLLVPLYPFLETDAINLVIFKKSSFLRLQNVYNFIIDFSYYVNMDFINPNYTVNTVKGKRFQSVSPFW